MEAGPLRIFVSYRRDDAAGTARLLYDRLASHFGGENVFLDVVTLQPGSKWLDDIKRHHASSGVLVALIGPRWLDALRERTRELAREQQDTDYVRLEIESALLPSSGVRVIPALIDDTRMPPVAELPRSLRALAARNAISLRHATLDDDIARLIARLEQPEPEPPEPAGAPEPAATATPPVEPAEPLAAEPLAAEAAAAPDATPPVELAAAAEPVPAGEPVPGRLAPPAAAHPSPVLPAPDARHYDYLARLLADVDEGTLVPVLGPAVNGGDRTQAWLDPDSGDLPDAEELATYLAGRFGVHSERPELAEITQHVFLQRGKSDLHKVLRRVLAGDAQPNSLHRFFAGLPARLERLGLPPRYQLLVTTNVDNALEKAFDEAEVPYDLAVYMAGGEHRGKFLHYPWGEPTPKPILVPNEYSGFPMDDFDELERVVIVKVHGGIAAGRGADAKESYVITEDDYISYLSQSPIESLIPWQLLNKMRDSHFLFLGYTMRDWSVRVFLQRIWRDQRPDASWAINRMPDVLEKEFWDNFGVDLLAAPLRDYIEALDAHLATLAASSVGP